MKTSTQVDRELKAAQLTDQQAKALVEYIVRVSKDTGPKGRKATT